MSHEARTVVLVALFWVVLTSVMTAISWKAGHTEGYVTGWRIGFGSAECRQ